mmetsp:Transcript_13251/g.28120  ORF Transcript_13251/g.28120 Transcript_13251/m.28120 type:complete len:580 (-) Transcript_13251:347-2086(-)
MASQALACASTGTPGSFNAQATSRMRRGSVGHSAMCSNILGTSRTTQRCFMRRKEKRRISFTVDCAATTQKSSKSSALVVQNDRRRGDWPDILASLSSAGSKLVQNVAKSGSQASNIFASSSREALQRLVGSLMTDICGMKVDIRGDLEILGGKALVLNDVKVGEEMYVNHIFLRAQLEPLLAVLKSWRDTPVGSEAPPIFVQSITVRGVKCKAVDVHGIMRAYSIFRDAPGSISIGRLSLANVQAEMSYHDEDLGEPVESEVLYGVDGKEQMGGARSVFIRRMEFKGFASRMSLADMSASIATYCEKGGANAGKAMELEDLPPIALLREPSPGGDGDFRETYQTPPVPESKTDAMKKKLKDRGLNLLNQVKSGKGLDILPERARVWVPPAVSDQINNQLQTTVQNLAPVVQGRVAGLVAESVNYLGGAVNLGDAAVDTWRAAAGTEAMIDMGLVLALLAQGLPRWFLSREGGRLMVKMVESGVAAALLTQGNLIKIMVDKRLLERMLELGLLERVLVRGDLTKQLIHQGVLRDILELEIIDAMVKPENVPVLYQLLDGEMLEVMVSTNILSALKVHSG